MAKYLQIPANRVNQLTVKFNSWFAIQPIETGDGRWVIPVYALKQMRDAILPILKKTVDRDKLITARDYLEARTILDDSEITWKENEIL
jgi:hypothetical protein